MVNINKLTKLEFAKNNNIRGSTYMLNANLLDTIEQEEAKFREENLNRLKDFLTKCNGQAITIDWNGIHFYPESKWHITRDLSLIVIEDDFEDMILGTTDIIIENIMDTGLELFCMSEDIFNVNLYNGDTINISID